MGKNDYLSLPSSVHSVAERAISYTFANKGAQHVGTTKRRSRKIK